MSATTRIEKLERSAAPVADSYWTGVLAYVAKHGKRLVATSESAP
ncbi:hypothetical protein SAMN04488059_11731 [Devosia psychrophila]|uniref:Uncharacterized protein n=1 Tax=Devosia psychrophila TaxID=728005 RepID=A0A1I1NRY3_9HYPH|nr:hypothetical protein SAMN04488059_11731 [Devosia psychrophila]